MKVSFVWGYWAKRKPFDIRSAHILLDTGKTGCGRHNTEGATPIGTFGEDARPDCQCCSFCVQDRKKLADAVRLRSWNALSESEKAR